MGVYITFPLSVPLALSGFQRAFQAGILIAGRTTGFDRMGQGHRPFSPIKQGFSQPWCLASVQCAVGVFLYGLRLRVVTSYIQRGGTECVYTEEHGKPTSSQRSEENLHFVGYAWKKWRCLLCVVFFWNLIFHTSYTWEIWPEGITLWQYQHSVGKVGLCFCCHSWPILIHDFGTKRGSKEKGGLLILDFMGSIHPDPSV